MSVFECEGDEVCEGVSERARECLNESECECLSANVSV